MMNYGLDLGAELLASDMENQNAQDVLDSVEREEFFHEVKEEDNLRAPLYVFEVTVYHAERMFLTSQMVFPSEDAVREWIKSVQRDGLEFEANKLKKIEFVVKTIYDLVESEAA